MNFKRRRVSRISWLSHFMLLLGFCFFSFGAFAQDEIKNAVRVELKSGVVLRGELIQITYNERLEIKVPGAENMVIQWDDISELNFIEAEVRQINRTSRKKEVKDFAFNDRKTFFWFDLSVPLGIDAWGDPVAGGVVQAGVAKGLGRRNSLGLTTGLEFYLWPDMVFMPIGLEYRGRLNSTGASWFYYLQGGYGHVLTSEYDWRNETRAVGGPFIAPGVGITRKTNPKRAWYLKFGFKSQTATADYTDFTWDGFNSIPVRVEERIFYRRLEIKYGFTFN